MVELLDPSLLSIILTFSFGLFASVGKMISLKTKLGGIKNFVNEVSTAIDDDKITPEEARRIILSFKALVK